MAACAPDTRRRIERWRNEVASLNNRVVDLHLSDPTPPSPVAVQTSPTTYTQTPEPKLVPAQQINSYSSAVNTIRHVPARRSSPRPAADRKSEPHIVRVVVQPSSSDDSTSRHRRRRSSRTEKSYPAVTAATTRSRPTANYATSRGDSDRRSRRSPPLTYTRSVRSRRSPSPNRKYKVIRRVLRLPERENKRTHYDDDYADRPRRPSKPVRPRAMSVDGRRAYSYRPRDDNRSLRSRLDYYNDSPYYYERPDRDQHRDLGRSGTVRSGYGPPPRRKDCWDDDRPTVPDRFRRIYDDVDKIRSIGTRRPAPPVDDDRRARRRSWYDDYDYDYGSGSRRSMR